jgi:hypothetical protein
VGLLATLLPDAAPTERRALELSLFDGVLYAIMVGCSESYLGALAVELGHRGTSLAVLVTVPVLIGAVAQLASGTLAEWVDRLQPGLRGLDSLGVQVRVLDLRHVDLAALGRMDGVAPR